MSEAEKQEGQKTVVAFITGLLIGGLLVWVFSSSPANAPQTQTESDETTTEETTDEENDQSASVVTSTTDIARDITASVGAASLTVDDQKAGDVVKLGKVNYPSENGWIVVREYANEVPGRILGAARYSTTDGLIPTEVSLLRPTVAGSSYQVVFYTESGDKKFSTTNDTLVKGGETTFKAN